MTEEVCGICIQNDSFTRNFKNLVKRTVDLLSPTFNTIVLDSWEGLEQAEYLLRKVKQSPYARYARVWIGLEHTRDQYGKIKNGDAIWAKQITPHEYQNNMHLVSKENLRKYFALWCKYKFLIGGWFVPSQLWTTSQTSDFGFYHEYYRTLIANLSEIFKQEGHINIGCCVYISEDESVTPPQTRKTFEEWFSYSGAGITDVFMQDSVGRLLTEKPFHKSHWPQSEQYEAVKRAAKNRTFHMSLEAMQFDEMEISHPAPSNRVRLQMNVAANYGSSLLFEARCLTPESWVNKNDQLLAFELRKLFTKHYHVARKRKLAVPLIILFLARVFFRRGKQVSSNIGFNPNKKFF